MKNNILSGLTQEEALKRLQTEGYNELPSAKKRSVWIIALEVLKEPMFLLLVACGSIYLVLGDVREALILLGFVFVIMGITFYQERKTERALEALRDLTSPRASVIRDGEKIKIAGREVVRDDIIILAEGDRVPADAVMLEALNLTVDESLLTGESVPVSKYPADDSQLNQKVIKPGGDNQPYIFSGTMIVAGQGIARVRATGAYAEIGKIGKSLQSIEEEETLLKKDVSRTVKIVGVSAGILCLIVVIVYGLTRADWLGGFLAGLTLAMAMIPEEFPVVLTVFLSLGAWRISQKRVLTRRIPAVETLGAATVLCVDKTGTLTINKMKVHKLYVKEAFYDAIAPNRVALHENCHEIIEYGTLASHTDPFDPMERAIRDLNDIYLKDTEHVHYDWEMVKEYPLSKSLLAMSRVWKRQGSEDYVIAAKGAPEAIADLCHLDKQSTDKLKLSIEKMADDGLRVIGVAKAVFKSSILPQEQHVFNFKFEGLIGLADPVREQVPHAIKECYQAGVRVIMITGDYPGTAKNIAAQIGLKNIPDIITGPELDGMNEGELELRIKNVNIFARVVPEQKLRIVNVLKKIGEIVAMTGDGVNDAPALKSANIGIAMGGRGTDVARESSSLVLLDDDFMSIVAAVRMGRRIFDNLKKAISYILAIHVPIAGLSLFAVIFKLPLILFPVHVVFLELIIDPACSLVFEAEKEEKGVMSRPPRSIREPLFSLSNVFYSLLQGMILFSIVAGVFVVSQKLGESVQTARALAFTTLIVGNLGLIVSNRSWILALPAILRQKNAALLWITAGAVIFMFLSVEVPFLRTLFKFGVLHDVDLAICFCAGITSVIMFEAVKLIRKYRHPA
ncbi:MAG: ATPase [Elusimicrobia bacterium RIFOXYA2_FULL_40_6]|nr:MAG: ATPase [Elusimicrobia bacterium RIFOXYA2_FULL_40_6]